MKILNQFRLTSVLAMAITTLGFSATAVEMDAEKVVNVYNWSDYIDDSLIQSFEKKYGIKVRYDTYDNNEILHAKLIAGRTNFDIVVPSSNWAKSQMDAGLFSKLDRNLLPNWKNLDPALLEVVGQLDKGNRYLVNWLWGYTTIGINTAKVKQALGGMPMPEDPWDLYFDPKYASKLKSCGISTLDSASEVALYALSQVGKDPYSENSADYELALKALQRIRPYVTLFSSSGYINDLANGSLCLSVGWSGDINIARNRAIKAKNGNDIQALIPTKVLLGFFDMMAIPADAPHPKNAHLFINHILEAQNHAAITNKVFYANPNKASLAFVNKDIAANPTIFLSDDNKKKLLPQKALNNEARRLQTRMFTRFKTNR